MYCDTASRELIGINRLCRFLNARRRGHDRSGAHIVGSRPTVIDPTQSMARENRLEGEAISNERLMPTDKT